MQSVVSVMQSLHTLEQCDKSFSYKIDACIEELQSTLVEYHDFLALYQKEYDGHGNLVYNMAVPFFAKIRPTSLKSTIVAKLVDLQTIRTQLGILACIGSESSRKYTGSITSVRSQCKVLHERAIRTQAQRVKSVWRHPIVASTCFLCNNPIRERVKLVRSCTNVCVGHVCKCKTSIVCAPCFIQTMHSRDDSKHDHTCIFCRAQFCIKDIRLG